MILLRSILFASTLMLTIQTTCIAAEDQPTSAKLTELASKVLPIEQSYDYHRSLQEGPLHQLQRDPAARPTEGEMQLPESGWKLLIQTDAEPLVRHAAEDLRVFLQVAMQVEVKLVTRDSLENWTEINDVIVLGTHGQLPNVGDALKKSKDYEIRVSPRQIVVCGFDQHGTMFGVYNLEQRMRLREAPYFPNNLNTVRHSLYQTRMALSWLGWMEWPDKYLARMAHDGFDGIFASVYANPNGVEGTSHYRLIRRQNPGRLHDLVKRANRQGIKVYAPILYSSTGEADGEEGLRKHVRDIVTKFPEIHGYILLSEGFHYKSFGAVWGSDKREWAKHWARAVQIATEECHRINPQIEILPWEYNLDFRPQGVELKRYIVSILPKETIPLLTWENGKSFEIDGLHGYLRDYSISQVGPAEASQAQIAEAKRRGMTVYCKADSFATWQFGTIPYLPCPQQWQRRYEALEKYGVDGTLETWSSGYKPNFVAELRAWSSWTDAPPTDQLLRSIARREFGPGSEELVLKAWNHFSEAIQLVPDTGPSMGTNFAVANPLFFQQPPPRTMMLKHSWWDEAKWSHSILGTKINSYWPYTRSRMVFLPDFTNRTNKAERYAQAVSGIVKPKKDAKAVPVLPVFNKYLLLAADQMEEGLRSYREAAFRAPKSKQAGALKEVQVAEQMQRMLRSDQAILEFEDLRFTLTKTPEQDKKKQILQRMTEILRQEIARTEGSLVAAQRDSRLGYQFEQDYVYTPYVLTEKLRLLRETLNQQIPKFIEGGLQSQ
ncbi:MAG: hypothetical protein GXP26_14215 [Planctomycetes bacterium]|nr:hypothetical protein [Planctomycetota bacterium]